MTAKQWIQSKTAKSIGIVLLCAAGISAACQSTPAWQNPALTAEQRAADLVAQMTLEEKVSQTMNRSTAIPRLGVPAYDWWSEGLHGIARSGYATVFPQAIGNAATFDAPLVNQIATVISTEARAKYNQAIRDNIHSIYFGLTIWSPNINIFRDPRWGRGQETYGEDPFLTSRMGVAFVNGLQGDDPHYLKTVATPKHYAVHSGPETERHRFNVNPSPYDLVDTYLPAFRATITEAHADSIMCAYNAIDSEPACASKMLLQQTLRDAWKFNGYVTSDCGAVEDFFSQQGHHYSPDAEHASAAAMLAGTDTNCGDTYKALVKAVKDGLIPETALNTAVERLFTARFRLGMFDPASNDPYASIPMSEDDSPEHRALALKAARESMVLLKNENGFLPLKSNIHTIAVIGPNAASLPAIEGNYNAIPSHPVLPLDGMRGEFPNAKILYAQGSAYVAELPIPVPETVLHPSANSTEAGLTAEYFASSNMSGQPVLTRTDHYIDFDWDAASPAPGVPMKDFGVRWSGTISAPAPGDYPFTVKLTDCYPCGDAEAYTVYLDGKQVAHFSTKASESRPSATPNFTLHFSDTQAHVFRLEYTHHAPLFGAGITLAWMPPANAEREQAVAAAKQADAVIAFVGLSPNLEGEEMPIHVKGFSGGDRTDIQLPAVQQQLLEAVAATGKPLVVVLMDGSALAVNWSQQHASAILEAWYPGEAGGQAIAETLDGKNNPAGRLPVTFYRSTDQIPAFDNYAMQGRTYRYFHGDPLYSFGYGLSYTQFAYSNLKLSSASVKAGDTLTAEADIRNTGQQAGDEVAELYLTPPQSALSPIHELEGFQRIHLAPGETQHVRFTLHSRQLSVVDAQGNRSVQSGQYSIFIGGQQPTPNAGLTQTFSIEGSDPLPPLIEMRALRILLVAVLAAQSAVTFAEDGAAGWLRYAPIQNTSQYNSLPTHVVALDRSAVAQSAAAEATRGLTRMLGHTVTTGQNLTQPVFVIGTVTEEQIRFPEWKPSTEPGPEGYVIAPIRDHGHTDWLIAGADARGALYGTFHLLQQIAEERPLSAFATASSPAEQIRWVNQWDNPDGSIERGYAGRSIFFNDGQVRSDLTRVAAYARLLASVGINGCAVNNVNADLRVLTPQMIPQLARFADAFRPWGVRLVLSVDLSSPKSIGGLSTYDPLDPQVIAWWQKKVDDLYAQIPDLAGFVVKADSEGQPGPSQYGRSPADAANLLARALKPHGGVLLYRAFVYDHHLDWRDPKADRARAAYDIFHPLDGKFDDNVVVQIKYGPIDFQVREPASPLFAGLRRTNEAIELEITQEYTGQQRHLVFLVPMWKQILDFDMRADNHSTPVKEIVEGKSFHRPLGGFAGVANVGLDTNWIAHPLAMANLYGFGRLAWNPDTTSDTIAEDWTRLTFGNDPVAVSTIDKMLLSSWRIYEQYTGPLGLGTLTDILHSHYGPDPESAERNGWGQWIRADHNGVGMDRTIATGTGFIGQYPPQAAATYESVATCPDDLLLFMHHVPYTHRLHSGTSVIQYIYDAHYAGAGGAANLVSDWKTLQGHIDNERYQRVLAQQQYQAGHAIVWRDAINDWFHAISGIPDEKGRVGHHPNRIEAESMQLTGYAPINVTPWETASGGKAIVCHHSVCSASATLHRPTGTYTISVQYFDYLHGASTYTLYLNQKPIANWHADNTLPADIMNGDTSTRYTLTNIDLHPGDKLKIEGQPDNGEPAPLDYIEITPASATNE